MKYAVLGIVFFLHVNTGVAQALRDINYTYLYDPATPFAFTMKPVRQSEQWNILYRFLPKDTTQQFSIQWEVRSALSDKTGVPVSAEAITTTKHAGKVIGSVHIINTDAVQILVAKVTNHTSKQAWLFYKLLEPGYPLNAYIELSHEPVLSTYLNPGKPVSVRSSFETSVVSFYDDDFPAAAPVFSEVQARVPQTLRCDSVFILTTGQEVSFLKSGLYLIQKDTIAKEGLTVRVQDDYPRLARLENLAGPLKYICTQQEFDRLKAAKGDKKAFDRVILSIAGDAERAKTFMRSYFRRVEMVNQYFTSYKEGWKTDRGMVYIIFGLPDEVYKFADREVWTYKNALYKITFTFAKSSTVYDPDNFVLIREKKYESTLYEVIDLWRNARF